MSDAAYAEDIDVKKHVRVYVTVFAALAVLTVVTVAVGYLRLPIGPALFVALLIAVIKGSLVAGYFMHLISEKKVIYAVLALTAVFFLVLLLLTLSSHYDQGGISAYYSPKEGVVHVP